jgi:hypothetical protein
MTADELAVRLLARDILDAFEAGTINLQEAISRIADLCKDYKEETV